MVLRASNPTTVITRPYLGITCIALGGEELGLATRYEQSRKGRVRNNKENRSTREIAKLMRMSFRDIGAIIKKALAKDDYTNV